MSGNVTRLVVFKRLVGVVCAILILVNVYGCVALLAGAAGGAGTAAWLSEKLSQEVNAPFDKAIKASLLALQSMNFEVTKETKQENIAQLLSKYSDGKTIWIDIRRISDTTSQIDVRVGAVKGDKEASSKILTAIQKYL
ncbi:MAG: DUF3568 family protein [Candidatus Omnitrophota bacterium]|jgi:hypothetical protein